MVLVHRLLIALWAACCLLLVSCTRGPDSPFIGPPIGSVTESELVRVRDLINQPDFQFSRPEEYRIGPGDKISLRMVGQPEMFGDKPGDKAGEFVVSESRLMTLPLVGSIEVHGKTVAELQEVLTKAYSQFFVNPIVVVSITEYFQNQFNIVGSVVHPGRYSLEAGDTLVDAIYKAGGLTFGGRTGGLAPSTHLILYRDRIAQQERLLIDPEEIVRRLRDDDGFLRPRREYRIPISDFLFRGVMEYNVPLRQNDIVYVVPAGSVNVLGPVDNPGVVFLGPSIQTLDHVLSARGGLAYRASSRVEVIRMDETGNPVTYFFDARDISRRKAEDFMLRDGDQVYCFTHPGRAVIGFFADLFRSSTRAGVNATYNPATGGL
ncbi:polysaccharide export protein [Candidatus Poribacteria bacterium]|nr:polysaccharide export protein [Candidatus Poribacteria bacterium]